MKVAKLKSKVQNRPQKERKACYKEYDDEYALKKDMEIDDNIWVRHQFKETIDDAGQNAYEQFVSGFLHYYDTEVRNDSIDHTVHFKWEVETSKHNSVTIFLNPAPLKTPTFVPPSGSATDPPRPQGPPPPPQS